MPRARPQRGWMVMASDNLLGRQLVNIKNQNKGGEEASEQPTGWVHRSTPEQGFLLTALHVANLSTRAHTVYFLLLFCDPIRFSHFALSPPFSLSPAPKIDSHTHTHWKGLWLQFRGTGAEMVVDTETDTFTFYLLNLKNRFFSKFSTTIYTFNVKLCIYSALFNYFCCIK